MLPQREGQSAQVSGERHGQLAFSGVLKIARDEDGFESAFLFIIESERYVHGSIEAIRVCSLSRVLYF